MKRGNKPSLTDQIKERQDAPKKKTPKYKGSDKMISTGSTLLNLAISGGRKRGGGIPVGIMVEIFGASGTGKTANLLEIAGNIQRQEGEIKFLDPEARINTVFAQIFDAELNEKLIERPNTVTDFFQSFTKWKPKPEDKIHGFFADSLAAFSTETEAGKDEPDNMAAMRKAKEFGWMLRNICVDLTKSGNLLICSNQIVDTTAKFGAKTKSPGGHGIEFYSSLRLQTKPKKKIKNKKTIDGKEQEKVIGIETEIYVFKSSVWEPYHSAPVYIIFDYGIDDIRANLQWLKDNTKSKVYQVNEDSDVHKSLTKACQMVENANLEKELRKEVIDKWEEIQEALTIPRKKKKR